MIDRPLHVCLISDEYPPDTGWGGIGTYTYNLARGLTAIGHRVKVIAGSVGAPRSFEEGGIGIHRVAFVLPRSAPRRGVYRVFQAATHQWPYYRRKLEFARSALRMFRVLHANDPFDVAETAEYDANAHYIAKEGLVPLVVKVHTPVLLNHHLNELPISWEVRLCDRLERAQSRRAAALTTPSRRMADYAAEWLRGRTPEVVPNPIDTTEFSPAADHASPSCDFFYTGRLEKRKGVHLLLQAFQKVVQQSPTARLVLAGHDTPTFPLQGEILNFTDYVERLRLLEGIADRVVFLGRVDRRELPAHYRQSRVCVFPSERFENFPYSCLEAMSCGKAVIVSDSGGMTEMMEDGRSGLKVPAGSVEELARAMLLLAAEPERAEAMGKEARRRVEAHYTLEAIARRTEEVYRIAARSRPRRRQ